MFCKPLMWMKNCIVDLGKDSDSYMETSDKYSENELSGIGPL